MHRKRDRYDKLMQDRLSLQLNPRVLTTQTSRVAGAQMSNSISLCEERSIMQKEPGSLFSFRDKVLLLGKKQRRNKSKLVTVQQGWTDKRPVMAKPQVLTWEEREAALPVFCQSLYTQQQRQQKSQTSRSVNVAKIKDSLVKSHCETVNVHLPESVKGGMQMFDQMINTHYEIKHRDTLNAQALQRKRRDAPPSEKLVSSQESFPSIQEPARRPKRGELMRGSCQYDMPDVSFYERTATDKSQFKESQFV